MMTKMPVGGVVWQNLHYLLGFERLGYDTYYVESHARTPSAFMEHEHDDGSGKAAAFIEATLRRFDLSDRWAFVALHDDRRSYGMSAGALARLYRSADLLINLHGGTEPLPEHYETGRLVYLETDPGQLQVELHDGLQETIDFLEPHCAYFTFAENAGAADCGLPISERFRFHPTRQPVLIDVWSGRPHPPAGEQAFTTVGNWRQRWRTVRLGGEPYTWTKDTQFDRFLTLPRRTGKRFELALANYNEGDRRKLEHNGWRLRDAHEVSDDADAYRRYIAGSLGEFTAAKEQNVRLRTGWFSDRSATYLAAGRPVITQDTGFGCVLPTGEGLLAVRDVEEAADAVTQVTGDYRRHRRGASALAREYFDAGRVLGRLLDDLGMGTRKRHKPSAASGGVPARRPPSTSSSVAALVPHFRCEEWLVDCLDALVGQSRPLDAILVIDDASEEPPTELVEQYDGVTLLRADRNVGPYALIQRAIEETSYDAYLFQDADDWSREDRLELLLEAAENTGAELLGTQEVRVFCADPEAVPVEWPLDVNATLAERPTAFCLLHPTSLVSRDLVMELGGFASGLRFSGDAEFLRRAAHVARVLNIPHHCYFRRIRAGSLTTGRDTGLDSPGRKRIMEALWERARLNAYLASRGRPLQLEPYAVTDPVTLTHMAGPRLDFGALEPEVAPR